MLNKNKKRVTNKYQLKAGRLDLSYEKGFLKYIKFGNQEVLRLINHAVRDYNWGTVPLRIFDEKMENRGDNFTIHYLAEAKQDDVNFLWTCTIEGKADSTISFTINGESLSCFKRNRIGFTVMHPIKECKGKVIHIKDPAGKTETQKFPELISPEQPFLNIRSMEWELEKGKAILEFSGDVFETEDQRNWTDDSYKTYCTPLNLPFPVELNKGDKVAQTIKLSIANIDEEAKIALKSTPTFSIKEKGFSLPKINIGRSTEIDTLSTAEINKLKAIPFDGYQVDIKLYEADWESKLKKSIRESNQLGFSLELSLFFDVVDDEIQKFTETIQHENAYVSTVHIFNKKPFVTEKRTVDAVLPIIRKLFPKATVGMGTNAFFAELNRSRLVTNKIDHVVYSFNPQVHASDNDSLIETIVAQPYTVDTAKDFSKGKPIHISPITFKMRWNPNATGVHFIDANQLPSDVDIRQMSLFGASWVLGTINSLLPAASASLTFFESVGLKGIMQSNKPLYKNLFLAPSSIVYPMYFIFKIILEHKNGCFYHVESEENLKFSGFAFGEKGKKVSIALIVNYAADLMSIKMPSEFSPCMVGMLTERNMAILMKDPERFEDMKLEMVTDKLKLGPYTIAIITNTLRSKTISNLIY